MRHSKGANPAHMTAQAKLNLYDHARGDRHTLQRPQELRAEPLSLSTRLLPQQKSLTWAGSMDKRVSQSIL